MKLSTIAVIFSMVLSTVYTGRRVHRARRNAKNLPSGSNIQGRKGLAEMLAALLPNTYYSRPKFRYPFYHKDGKEIVLFSILRRSINNNISHSFSVPLQCSCGCIFNFLLDWYCTDTVKLPANDDCLT